MNTKTYTVTENGVETVHEVSPEMQKILARISDFNRTNPDFWCHCDAPETEMIVPRGHSVDVFCRCGGVLQVG